MTHCTPGPARGDGFRWLVSEDSAGLFPIHTGTAPSTAHAWIAAIDLGRQALLKGHIEQLAIAVDDLIPTCGYNPGRDEHGRLTPDHVAHDLDRLLGNILRDLPRQHTR